LPVRFSISSSTSARRASGRLMRDRGMQGVELVLEEDLPVGVLDHAEAVRHDLDLALGRAVADVVEGDLRAPEELEQPRTVGGEAGEHEAAVVLHARCALHVAVGIVAGPTGAGVAGLHHRDGAQLAVVVESPGMVGAAEEFARIAAPVAAHHRAPVRATIVEHVHFAVLAAHHEHRLAADLRRVVIARLRHLASRGRSRSTRARGCAPSPSRRSPRPYTPRAARDRLDELGEVGDAFVQHCGLLGVRPSGKGTIPPGRRFFKAIRRRSYPR